jgi:hypothetical protein
MPTRSVSHRGLIAGRTNSWDCRRAGRTVAPTTMCHPRQIERRTRGLPSRTNPSARCGPDVPRRASRGFARAGPSSERFGLRPCARAHRSRHVDDG